MWSNCLGRTDAVELLGMVLERFAPDRTGCGMARIGSGMVRSVEIDISLRSVGSVGMNRSCTG